jgi:hypothetical protein
MAQTLTLTQPKLKWVQYYSWLASYLSNYLRFKELLEAEKLPEQSTSAPLFPLPALLCSGLPPQALPVRGAGVRLA